MPPSQVERAECCRGCPDIHIERVVQGNQRAVLEGLTHRLYRIGRSGLCGLSLSEFNGQETDVCIGTRGKPGVPMGTTPGRCCKRLSRAIFPRKFSKILAWPSGTGIAEKAGSVEKDQATTGVTAVTGVPALSAKNRDHFMQGLERFIDAAERRSSSICILAEPVLLGVIWI